MAPIIGTTATGVSVQVFDDSRMHSLHEGLQHLDLGEKDKLQSKLVSIIRPYAGHWPFEEQVDLHMWIHSLNAIDVVLRLALETYPNLLLIAPVPRNSNQKKTGETRSPVALTTPPESLVEDIQIVLQFLAVLLRNSFCKTIFNSVYELTDFLAASDDRLSLSALTAIYNWVLPSQLHKQAGNHNMEQMHAQSQHHQPPQLPHITQCRCMAMARAWGTRAQDLGLFQVVTADAAFRWPEEPGHVKFVYSPDVTIEIPAQQLLSKANNSASEEQEQQQNDKKRRRLSVGTKSTSEIFSMALEQLNDKRAAASVDSIPPIDPMEPPPSSSSISDDRLFSLLTDIRLARSYKDDVLLAVNARLQALVAMLQAHPSQEMVAGYFQAQPELIVELVELLRPTVSAMHMAPTYGRPDPIAHLANAQPVPHSIRILAVEALTALVARRDGGMGAGLSSEARLSSVMTELGVAKGMYMGVLPTLLRYSLAAITTAVTPPPVMEIDDAFMDMGLAFVEATMGPQPPRRVQVELLLVWLDSILNLTMAVVSTPAGTAVLTESGIVPSLLATVALDTPLTVQGLLSGSDSNGHDSDYDWITSHLRFVTAQAVQILEGVIVAQTNASAAFHDLRGIQVLTDRLSREMKLRPPTPSQRVLLYSIVTCLTVVFHQESNSITTAPTNTATLSGSSQLKQPALTESVIAILKHVPSYGGHLASLVATLLSDVLNHDPHVVHYVHESGIAQAFFDMIQGKVEFLGDAVDSAPLLSPVPELIMAIPNVLAALALTEDGAKAVKEANPFPALCSLFYNPRYAMPASKCLLNELTAIVGTGLEEIMRHVEGVKPLVMGAIVDAMNSVVRLGEELSQKEALMDRQMTPDLETERTCLIQYVLNLGQLLEQVLHNEEHVGSFCSAGGFLSLLALYKSSMPKRWNFLAHVSALSSVTVSTLHHSTIEDCLNLAFKCIFLKHNPKTVLEALCQEASQSLEDLMEAYSDLGIADDRNVVRYLPDLCLFSLGKDELPKFARLLAGFAMLTWVSGSLSMALKAAGRRMDDHSALGGPAFTSSELAEWRAYLASPSFGDIVAKLAEFQRGAIWQVCHARAESLGKPKLIPQACRYRLRIVCPEGAVVRDGIEIDSCASVGSMEMGEIVDALDRCINSSGILRYRTSRGWISEMTRGHGREPITEVINIWEVPEDVAEESAGKEALGTKRIECRIPSIADLGVGILARMQRTYGDMMTSLSRLVVQCFRSMGTRNPSFDDGTIGGNLVSMLDLLFSPLKRAIDVSREAVISAGSAMYYGCVLDQLLSSLFFDERRERRMVNFLLLAKLVGFESEDSPTRLFDCITYVFDHCLQDFQAQQERCYPKIQRVGHSVASCFPPVVKFLRRLMSTHISSSPVATVMSRIKWKHLKPLLGTAAENSSPDDFFQPEDFIKVLQLRISMVVQKFWADPRLLLAPPHLLHPAMSLIGDVIVGLEEFSKKKKVTPTSSRTGESSRTLLSDWIRERSRLEQAQQQSEETFEPSDDAVARLEEMGFSHDHALEALESTRSNRIEVAMEYALLHPPPDPATVARRLAGREERQQRRRELTYNDGQGVSSSTNGQSDSASGNDGSGDNRNPENAAGVQPMDLDNLPSGDKDITLALESWIEVSPKVCLNILATPQGSITRSPDGDAESEAVTVVVTSFLLDLCHRYPEQKDKVVSSILDMLKTNVETGDDVIVSKLAHSTVLVVKALPKTRLMVLRKGLISPIVARLKNFTESELTQLEAPDWPMWLPPFLLIVDTMAQPVVVFAEDDYKRGKTESDSSSDDYYDVLKDHESQSEAIAKDMRNTFYVLGKSNIEQSAMLDPIEIENTMEQAVKAMPAYFPLIPLRYMDVCLTACRSLIGCDGSDRRISPPPGVLQACLMLLLHLLRTPAAATDCLRGGVVEAILSVPAQSRFNGNCGLVTLILRRLLEDEATLLSAMETEIRTTVAKLSKKEQSKNLTQTENGGVSLKAFVESATPLLCRDASVFLKAMSLTLKIHDPQTEDIKVSLQPVEERSKKIAGVTYPSSQKADAEAATPSKPKRKSLSRRRSSSSNRARSLLKSSKKGKRDKIEWHREDSTSASTTPATMITCHLVEQILTVDQSGEPLDVGSGNTWFLSQWELLGILSDLILAVPACASSVHNYRSHRSKDRQSRLYKMSQMSHALTEAPQPTKTFVNFLLHVVLAQDRWGLRNDDKIWGRSHTGTPDETEVISRKKEAAQIMKTSQAAARVLLALTARPGEGRRRVIVDLAFALSSGRLGHTGTQALEASLKTVIPATYNQLNALYSWGELCLGLAVPRGGGKNLETSISVNYEMVRIMFECGLVHALLYAAQLVPLDQPMASSTLGTLLLPLELMTRANVTNYVAEMARRDMHGQGAVLTKNPILLGLPDSQLMSETESGHNEFFQSAVNGEGDFYMQIDGEEEENSDQDEEEDMDDMEMEEEEDVDSQEESIEDDNGEDDLSEEDQSESEEEGEESEDSDDETEEVGDEGAWNLDYERAFGPENPPPNDADDGADDPGDRPSVDEGWTRLEPTGFGGMFLGGLTSASNNGDLDGDRARGFIDAAEAMIGTLLRSGEINQDSLAEIEGQLGIRITGTSRRLRHLGLTGGPGSDPGGLGDAFTTRLLGGPTPQQGRNGDVVGTLPHIHQRSQPDAGYSTFGGSASGRLADLSSIEIVFGGPSVTSGSRNYDVNGPLQSDPDDQQLPHITQLDLQLFPGGPASAAIARTQQSLHPLLGGVDLPPINSLVVDLVPHGVRARRSGQMNTRRPSDWTNASFSPGGYLVSTATGNIIRSNRPHTAAALGAGLPTRGVLGPAGWTDDGLQVDATVEELGSVLQAELARFLRDQAWAADTAPVNGADGPNNHVADSENGNLEHALHARSTSCGELAGDEQDISQPALQVEREEDSPSTASEGERVASSLAATLRLSPQNDGGETKEIDPFDEIIGIGEPDEHAISREEPETSARWNTEGARAPGAMSTRDDVGDVAVSEPHVQGRSGGPEEPQSVDDEEPEIEEIGGQDGDEGNDILVCPPNIEPDVFHSLPREMQRDVVNEHTESQDLAAQLDGTSLDREILAVLPEDVLREVLEQERRERMRDGNEAASIDPSRATEMDPASFIESLSPELRADILVTIDEETLNSLPPNLRAEAHVLRERAAQERQRAVESIPETDPGADLRRGQARLPRSETATTVARKKPRTGKIKVEVDRESVVYIPESLSPPVSTRDVQLFFQLFFLLSPIRPPRLLQKILQNLCGNHKLRLVLSTGLLQLLHERGKDAALAVDSYAKEYSNEKNSWRSEIDSLFPSPTNFPPASLLGVAPEIPQSDEIDNFSAPFVRLKQGLGAAASVAANMPKSTGGGSDSPELPPVVAARLIDTLQQLCKSSPRFCVHTLAANLLSTRDGQKEITFFESMMDLIQRPRFLRSSASLDQLLALLETAVGPLSHLPRSGEEEDPLTQRDIDSAAASGREWVDVPFVVIDQERLQALCSILRMESCRESAFAKVNAVLRRLCRVDSNRRHVLAELASVAHSLGEDAVRDLKELKIRMNEAAAHTTIPVDSSETEVVKSGSGGRLPLETTGKISSSVTFSTSTSEMKLLRVLHTLHSMCSDTSDELHGKKTEGMYVTEELVHLLRQLDFGPLWDELSSCLKIVQVLEGVSSLTGGEDKASEDHEIQDEVSTEDAAGNKKLRNSSAGLLSRFLPSIEAFFVATASATKPGDSDKASSGPREIPIDNIVGGARLIEFVNENRILLNALIRNNPGLLDRGMRALVVVPSCRAVLDFDVKRHWFKTQVRRLRQQARRHGNIRLNINRKTVFEEAYQQLRLRNADEMRGRLHITFRDEEGIDAGGLSREFFAILAKEMFNKNYALFTSTEDGCTFQPNPNSSINPDHLSYFRFCGRIVGKAVADGYLLDAHFTRSLYKHMLGIKPSHHDMEAIDPDYYRNLKTILEYRLDDIGLDLHFSIDDNSFGRSKVIDLIPNGRTIPVTDENKEKYVQLVCDHRMTTSIQNQIKAYLDGFYELVSPDLIAIFTPRELELVISGLPDIDVDDLKKNTEYVGWKATDKEIQWFWNIMTSLSRNQKAAFVQFVTGSSKVPLGGFGELQGMRGVQKFSIHKVTNMTKGALMSAHTCFNSLDLPAYLSEDEMRVKLLYAINEGAGSFSIA